MSAGLSPRTNEILQRRRGSGCQGSGSPVGKSWGHSTSAFKIIFISRILIYYLCSQLHQSTLCAETPLFCALQRVNLRTPRGQDLGLLLLFFSLLHFPLSVPLTPGLGDIWCYCLKCLLRILVIKQVWSDLIWGWFEISFVWNLAITKLLSRPQNVVGGGGVSSLFGPSPWLYILRNKTKKKLFTNLDLDGGEISRVYSKSLSFFHSGFGIEEW